LKLYIKTDEIIEADIFLQSFKCILSTPVAPKVSSVPSD